MANSKLEIEHRRKRVRQMLEAGASVQAIAAVLKVHRNTIAKDKAAIIAENKERVQTADAQTEIGSHLSFLDNIEQKAMADYMGGDAKAAAKAQFLQIALRARSMKIDIQQSTGMLPKAADKVEIEQLYKTESGADIRNMSEGELHKLLDEMMFEMHSRAKKGKKDKDEESKIPLAA